MCPLTQTGTIHVCSCCNILFWYRCVTQVTFLTFFFSSNFWLSNPRTTNHQVLWNSLGMYCRSSWVLMRSSFLSASQNMSWSDTVLGGRFNETWVVLGWGGRSMPEPRNFTEYLKVLFFLSNGCTFWARYHDIQTPLPIYGKYCDSLTLHLAENQL